MDLAGLVLGVLVPPILLFTRPISFFVRQLRKGFGKPMAPNADHGFHRLFKYLMFA